MSGFLSVKEQGPRRRVVLPQAGRSFRRATILSHYNANYRSTANLIEHSIRCDCAIVCFSRFGSSIVYKGGPADTGEVKKWVAVIQQS
jgi:hypothetical protein